MSTNSALSCLLVHGWGMNHHVWHALQSQLPAWLETRALDLPGHGLRNQEGFACLQDLVVDLQRECESHKRKGKPLLLVGWSLGALPCLQLAWEQADLVDGLLLVSSNPCFVKRDAWPAGVEAKVFDQFADSLKADFSGTIRRFLSLQVKGSESGRKTLRDLREKILQQPRPDQHSLDAGLEILKQVDIREQLSAIQQPVSWALGGQDGLVKAGLADSLLELMPQAKVDLYDKAGHAPFLSHTDAFKQQLIECAETTIDKFNESN